MRQLRSRRIHSFRLAMDHNVIVRLDEDVVQRIPRQRRAQRYAEYSGSSVWHRAKELRGLQPALGSDSARLIYRVAQMLLSGSAVAACRADFAGNQYLRRGFEIVPPKNAHRVQRFQLWRRFWMFKSRSKIETLHYRAVIGP